MIRIDSQQVRNIICYALGVLFAMSILNFAVLSIESVFYRYQPASYWFRYSKIESEHAQYPIEQPAIVMRSHSQWRRGVSKAYWVDALYCDFLGYGQFTFIGSQSVSGSVALRPEGEFVELWRLSVVLPDEPASCKVVSVIDINVRGFEKTQTIESNTFLVVDPNQVPSEI